MSEGPAPARRPAVPDPRDAAVRLVERILSGRRPAGRLLREAGAVFDPRDRNLLRELVLGTLRWLLRLDAVLEAASSRPLAVIDPELLAPLRVGLYQLLFLDRVPPHAAVNQAVNQARLLTHRGGAGFVNAVLRRVAEAPRLEAWPVEAADPVRRLAVETSHPELLVKRWLRHFGEERTRAVLAANNRAKPPQLLAFKDRGGRAALAAALAGEEVAAEPSVLSPCGLVVRGGDPLATAAFRRGDLYLQDEASQAAAWIPPPIPGETAFDAAAAPGGKSFALLAWEPAARVLAADRTPARLAVLRDNLARLRRRLPLLVADGLRSPVAGRFRRVIVDFPCTGSGTLRKHPELKWRIGQTEIERLARQALRLLRAAAPAVEPGGLLIAISCSLEVEENQGVVDQFLARESGFAALDLEGLLPAELAPGAAEGAETAGDAGRGRWQVLPAGAHDGFTVHCLRRSP